MGTIQHKRTTSHDGINIAYRLHGNAEAPWLVLSNGAGCSEHYWTGSLIPTLEDRFHIVEWDYRGHYDSDPAPHNDAYLVEDHAQDLLAILDAENIENAVFMGFSMGVQVVLEAYSRRPTSFKSLALINGSYEDPIGSMWGTARFRPLLVAMLEFCARHPKFVGTVIRFGMGGPLALPFAKINRFCEDNVPKVPFTDYMQKIVSIDPVAYMRTLRLMGEHSAKLVLPEVRVPCLLVAGPEDTMTPIQKMEQMRDAIPDTEYHVIEGGRHTLLFTSGEWIGNTLVEFLTRREIS